MATTTYFDHVIDPATGQSIEVCDKYAREQLVHKVEKTIVNSLPAKPTSYDAWTAMEPFLYWVPVDGQENDYQVWTLFFIGDPTDPSDYTDTDNYEWAQVADTDVDLSNFSTKGHTHEVIPETEVYDHEYTPQGTVSGSFTDASGTAAANGSHQHSVTVPSQNVTGTLSGTAGTTGSGSQHRHAIDLDAVNITGTLSGTTGTTGAGSQHRHGVTVPSVSVSGTLTGTEGTTSAGSSHTHSVTPTKKKMSTKKMSVSPATTVNFSGSTTNAQRATGVLETLGTYDPTKAVFNGFSVVDGGLVFTVKKMTTADTVSGLQASVDASKVTYDGNGTATNVDVATGGLTDGQTGDPLVMTDVSVQSESGHTHGFTPAGTVSGSTTSSTVNTEYESGHTHDFTPSGTVSGTTASITGNTGYENEHTHSFTPAGTVPITVAEQTVNTESNGSHTHDVSVSGEISATFQGMRANLKHKVDNKKVITSPDKEDPSSHVFDWYGIEFDEDGADPIKPRVGNMDMHKTLPIQSKMRRCLLNDDGTVYNYLDDGDSTRYANGSIDMSGNDISGQLAELEGSARSTYGDETSTFFDVQVMVEIPEHWRMVRTYLNGSTTMVKAIISPYPQETAGWIHVKKGYISAYEASIIDNKLCSVSNIVGLTLALQDGKIVASCDVSTATGQSDITSQLPTTNKNLNDFRTAARARNNGGTRWNQQVYEQYLAVVWLYWIEYANLNSQAPFTTALDINGYRQGGLGNGATTVNSTLWNNFNSRSTFIPCGITNCLGNHSGEVYLTLPSGLGGGTVAVSSYRGIENFFGHIWKWTDGVLCDIESGAEGLSKLYVCDTPSNFSNSITTDYEYRGDLSRTSGYVKSLILGEYGEIMPLETDGGSTTYFCDYFYTSIPSSGTDTRGVLLGGNAGVGVDAGVSCLYTRDNAEYRRLNLGSRLSFFEK